MDQHYTLSRTFGDDDSPDAYSTFTVSNYDAINCAHMLAAGFNTMSRNMLNGWVLAVVDAKDGRVYYDGKTEQIKRDEPWSVSQTMHFEASPGASTLFQMFDDDGNARLTVPGNFTFADNPKAAETLAKSAAPHIARSVLEASYAELQAVKEALYIAGAETITADVGVKDLSAALRARDDQIAELQAEIEERKKLPRWKLFADVSDALRNCDITNDDLPAAVNELGRRLEFERSARHAMELSNAEQNAAARAEMLVYMQGARAKYQRVDPGRERDDLIARFRGMLDVFAKFLVATGEAENDERHAVARRLLDMDED